MEVLVDASAIIIIIIIIIIIVMQSSDGKLKCFHSQVASVPASQGGKLTP